MDSILSGLLILFAVFGFAVFLSFLQTLEIKQREHIKEEIHRQRAERERDRL